MIDLYTSRRAYPLKCLLFKRDEKQLGDSDELIHNTQPSGIFYARIVSDKYNSSEQYANVFDIKYQELQLETNDKVNCEEHDIILVRRKKWLVISTREMPLLKNMEFSTTESKRTTILVRSV